MEQPSWQAFQKQVTFDERLAYVLLPMVYYILAWGVYEFTAWLTWLTIPVALAVALMLVLIAFITLSQILLHVKRADTATQTLRAAAQGRIELRGTLRPVGGEALISPLYGIPCVSYEAEFTAVRGTTGRATLRETVFPDAVLLTDGVDEVFLPVDESHHFHTQVELSCRDAPIDLLRADLREQISEAGWRVLVRREVIIPCDKPMQVNAFFHTLTTADSYLETQAKHLGMPPPELKTLEKSREEKLWRDYCQRRQEASGAAHPVTVNALLSNRALNDIGLVRVHDANWRDTVKTIGMVSVFAPGGLYLFLRLTGIIDRWDPLF